MTRPSRPSSSPPDHTEAPEPRKRGAYWAFVPVLLLGFLMSIVGTMVIISANDPHFAVEPDYYDKAVDWDEKRAQDAENTRLGWKVSWSFETAASAGAEDTVFVRLGDAAGTPIAGAIVSVEAFHNAHAANVQRLALTDTGAGRYHAKLRLLHPGIWEFRLRVDHHGKVFTRVHRAEFTQSSFALNHSTRTAQGPGDAASGAVPEHEP